jgi:hypothetical protein
MIASRTPSPTLPLRRRSSEEKSFRPGVARLKRCARGSGA